MAPERIRSTENDASTTLRSMPRVSPAMKRLVTTAKRPEIEIACPACPSVTPRSVGDRRQQADRHELRRDQRRPRRAPSRSPRPRRRRGRGHLGCRRSRASSCSAAAGGRIRPSLHRHIAADGFRGLAAVIRLRLSTCAINLVGGCEESMARRAVQRPPLVPRRRRGAELHPRRRAARHRRSRRSATRSSGWRRGWASAC